MRAELKWIEKTENYLMGNLASPDRKEFEARFESDPQFKLQVDFQRTLMDGIWSIALKGAAVKGFQLYKLRLLFWKIGFIAVIGGTVVFSIIYWSNTQKTETSVSTDNHKKENGLNGGLSATGQPKQNHVLLKMDLRKRPEDLKVYKNAIVQNQLAGDAVDKNTVIPANVFSNAAVNVEAGDNLLKSDPEEKVWSFSHGTSKNELERITEEIASAGGELHIKTARYRGDKLVRIAFVVTSKNGEASYDSGDLMRLNDGKICIWLGEKTISAGWCGGSDVVE